MKILLKLTVSLFVCGVLLLTGCGTPSASLPDVLKASNADYPKSVNIIAPGFFQGASAEIKQPWLDEMSKRYGVKFNIISNDFSDQSNFDDSASSKVQDVLKGDTSYKGLFIISDDGTKSDLNSGIVTDSLVPLEDHLADNPVWNALPEDFKSLFEVDGHIYAIPAYASRTLKQRFLNNEAVEKTGITVTDLDSFREFALAYTKETGYPAISGADSVELADILNMFGLYAGNSENNPFAYDPKEDCYVDFMTKGAAVEAFEYLRELYKAGALSMEYTGHSSFTATNYGEYHYNSSTQLMILNPKYPKVAVTGREGFAMAKDTPQPKETINLLVNMLFGSQQNYLECWLGTPDHYILNSDGSITIKMERDSQGKYHTPHLPNLTGGLSEIFPYSDANIFYSRNGVIDMDTTAVGQYNAYLKQQNDYFKSGAAVEIPYKCLILRSKTYDARKTDVGSLFLGYFEKAITNSNQTVQQILEEYKAKMLNMGGNQMLDEMNAAIGKKTAYYYG